MPIIALIAMSFIYSLVIYIMAIFLWSSFYKRDQLFWWDIATPFLIDFLWKGISLLIIRTQNLGLSDIIDIVLLECFLLIPLIYLIVSIIRVKLINLQPEKAKRISLISLLILVVLVTIIAIVMPMV